MSPTLLLGLALSALAAAAAAAPQHALDVLRRGTKAWVTVLAEHGTRGAYGNDAIRDHVAAGWACLSVYGAPNVSAAVTFIARALPHQLPDGAFPWTFNETTNLDPNSVEFISLPLARAFLHFQDAFPDGFVAAAQPHLRAAAAAVLAHQVPPSYTNIYTMRLVNLLLYGALLHNETLAAAGLAAAEAWITELGACRVYEYASPTYSAVAWNNLESGVASLRNATAAALPLPAVVRAAAANATLLLQRALDYYAADLAANYFPPAVALAGSHSRDYDFMTGTGGMDAVYILGGPPPASVGPEAGVTPPSFVDPITQSQLYLNYERGDSWPFPAAAWALAALGGGSGNGSASRLVEQVWLQAPGDDGAAQGRDRVTFIGRRAALGTSSAFYGQQDRQVAGALGNSSSGANGGGGAFPNATAPRLAQMSHVFDPFDSPYGQARRVDSGGHSKPVKLDNSAAAVQAGGAALVLSDLTPEWQRDARWGQYDSVSAAVLFPWNVEAAWLNGQALDLAAARPCALPAVPLNSTLAVYNGGGALAVRVFAVDGIGGYVPRAALLCDGPPGSYAGRLVAYLYEGPNRTFHNASGAHFPSRFGALYAAADVPDAAAARAWAAAVAAAPLTQRYDAAAALWSAQADVGALAAAAGAAPLVLDAGLATANMSIAWRRVAGAAFAPRPFTVSWANGSRVDVPAPTL